MVLCSSACQIHGMGNATGFLPLRPEMRHRAHNRYAMCALLLTATCTRTGTKCSLRPFHPLRLRRLTFRRCRCRAQGHIAPTMGSSALIRAFPSMKTILREALSVLSFLIAALKSVHKVVFFLVRRVFTRSVRKPQHSRGFHSPLDAQ